MKHMCRNAPGPECSCGIHALDSFGELHRQARQERLQEKLVVFGRVALWGQVCIHEHGARGEVAYPVNLTVPRSTLELLKVDMGLDRAFDYIGALLADYGITGDTHGLQPVPPGLEDFNDFDPEVWEIVDCFVTDARTAPYG